MRWNIISRSESVTPNIIKVPTIRNNPTKKHNIVFCVKVTSPKKASQQPQTLAETSNRFQLSWPKGEGSRRWRSSFEYLCGRAGRCRLRLTRSVWGWVVTFPEGEEQDTTFLLPPSKSKHKFQAFFVWGDFLNNFLFGSSLRVFTIHMLCHWAPMVEIPWNDTVHGDLGSLSTNAMNGFSYGQPWETQVTWNLSRTHIHVYTIIQYTST